MKKIFYSKAIYVCLLCLLLVCFLCMPFILGGCVNRYKLEPCRPLRIVNEPPPDGCRGLPYEHDFEAACGTGPDPGRYTWSSSGDWPSWLELDEATGLLHGTPTADGVYRFTVELTDSSGQHVPEDYVIEISLLKITTSELPPFCPGIPYGPYRLEACGVTNPLLAQWSVESGSLPTGMELLPEGVIQLLSNDTTESTFTVSVREGVNTDTKEFTLSPVDTALPEIMTPPVLPRARTDEDYQIFLKACGGTPPYRWAETSGVLPGNELAPGVTYRDDGEIYGVPCRVDEDNGYTFQMEVEDNAQETHRRIFLLSVDPSDVRITNPSPGDDVLPSADECASYSGFDFEAEGGSGSCADMYEWSVGTEIKGLSLDPPTGALYGSPWVPGSHTFAVKVTDSGTGDDDNREVTLLVEPDTTDDLELVCDRARHLITPPYNRISLTSQEDVKIDFHFDQSYAPVLSNLLQTTPQFPPGGLNAFIKGAQLRVSGCCIRMSADLNFEGPIDLDFNNTREAGAHFDSGLVQWLLDADHANKGAGDTVTLRLWVDVEYEDPEGGTHTETYTTRIEDVAIIP